MDPMFIIDPAPLLYHFRAYKLTYIKGACKVYFHNLTENFFGKLFKRTRNLRGGTGLGIYAGIIYKYIRSTPGGNYICQSGFYGLSFCNIHGIEADPVIFLRLQPEWTPQ